YNLEQVTSRATIQFAANRMADREIGFLAVSDGLTDCGVLTDRDIVIRCLANHKNPQQTTVAECMTPQPVSVFENAGVHEAAKLMVDHQIRRLIVTAPDGQLTGVVSLGDIATECAELELQAEILEKVSGNG